MNHPIENPRPMGLANELWGLSFDGLQDIVDKMAKADAAAVASAGLALAGWGYGDVSVIHVGDLTALVLVGEEMAT